MEQLLSSIVQQLFAVNTQVTFTRPDPKFGDFATNVALQLAKQVGKSPREVAEQVAKKLREESTIDEVSIAGPGFINIRLSDSALLALLGQQTQPQLTGKKVLVEYSDPNPLKPLHAGHLYTTLVGDMIARLLERVGAEVVRINYGGDVGMHTAKSMWAIIKELDGEHVEKLATIPESERASWLGARYVAGNNAYEDDEELKNQIIAVNKKVYQIHYDNDHESPFAELYWTVRQWSYDYFHVLYKELQVHEFDRFIPESEVTQLGISTVREQLENGVYEKSDQGSAIVFDGDKYGLHTRVFINSEGLPTYETKDVGLSITKWNDYHFDKSIIITASEQEQYMKVVYKSIEQYMPELAERTEHLTHGVVKLSGGVKMSSRKGNIVSALDILKSAHAAGAETDFNPSEETILAAVKYAFAKVRIGGDIAYDPKESIALDGNSGPYLQYAHARARSILEKSDKSPSELSSIVPDANERLLVLKLTEAREVIQKAASELMPHYICTYLYELAQEFNRFYEKSRVIDDPRETQRLALITAYAQTLADGLGLLGITAPHKM